MRRLGGVHCDCQQAGGWECEPEQFPHRPFQQRNVHLFYEGEEELWAAFRGAAKRTVKRLSSEIQKRRGGGWASAEWSNSPQLSYLPRPSLAWSSAHWWLHVVFDIHYHLYGLQQEGFSCLFLIVDFIMSLRNLSFFIAIKYYSGLLSCSGCDQLEIRAWDVLIYSM